MWGQQTLAQLARQSGRTIQWVRDQLDATEVHESTHIPQPTVVVPDTTFWGRGYGVCIFRSWNLKQNIWRQEVLSEKQEHYHYGRRILEERGWSFTAAVVDGRRGLTAVFADIPVQICQFHQIKRVTKYLTRKPKTEAGKELRSLALTLTKTTEEAFAAELAKWERKWHDFYTEKTRILGTNQWYYTHKNVRSAYLSLKRNLPFLFTYLKYPELNIPNTTNTADGFFSTLKKKVGAHHGLRKDRRYKVISEILNGDNSLSKTA